MVNKNVVILSDTLNVRLIELLKETLTGVKYNKEALKDELNDLGKEHSKLALQVEDFSVWLVLEVEG